MSDKLRAAAKAVLESTKSFSVYCENFCHLPRDLHDDGECPPWRRYNDALAELEAALAEPAIKESLTTAKPVAWMSTKMAGVVIAHQPEDFQRHPDRWQPLYAAQMLLPATEYICKCGLRVTPHRCKTDMEF